MVGVTGAALGSVDDIPLKEELSRLAKAAAGVDSSELQQARDALVKAAGNDHALLDAAGVAAFFCSITKIVDFSGHHGSMLPQILGVVCKVLSGARCVRKTICCSRR